MGTPRSDLLLARQSVGPAPLVTSTDSRTILNGLAPSARPAEPLLGAARVSPGDCCRRHRDCAAVRRRGVCSRARLSPRGPTPHVNATAADRAGFLPGRSSARGAGVAAQRHCTLTERVSTRQRTFVLQLCCSAIDALRAGWRRRVCRCGCSGFACSVRRCGCRACRQTGVGCGSGFEGCRWRSDCGKKVCKSKIKAAQISRTARACSAFHGPFRDLWTKSGPPDFSLGAPL